MCIVAEKMKRPLYSMSAGELGETAKEVEHSVESVLELAALWDAILLLDECDIFLERRSTKEIKRNRLVASTSILRLDVHFLNADVHSFPPTAGVL